MNQDNQSSSSSFPLQPPPRGQKRLHDSDSHSSRTNKCEHVFLTFIRATNVASGLRRIPAGFHVIVEVDGRIILQTSNKPVSTAKDAVEWDEEILLPSNQSSFVSFSVYASFELGPRLGNGELLGQFKITVGEVFHRQNQQIQLINFTAEKSDILPSCSSLRIITEGRICEANECPKFDLPEPRKVNALDQFTDEGHRALVRYRQRQDQMDLDTAIQTFERVQEICPIDYPNRSAVLFNLANAKFIDCQANNRYLDLDASIGLYQDALRLRTQSHPDHCITVLELGLALLARFQRRGFGFEFYREEAKDLLAGVVEVLAADSHACRAGLIALRMIEASVGVEAGDAGSSPAEQANGGDMIQKMRDLLHHLSNWSPHRMALLVGLGVLLSARFDRNGVLADIHEAISMFENALDLMPNSHPGMLSLLEVLGSALSHRFERLGDLADLNRSISTKEEAVLLKPNGDPDKPVSLDNLGNSLLGRFERFGDLADLNKSVWMRSTRSITSKNHPTNPLL